MSGTLGSIRRNEEQRQAVIRQAAARTARQKQLSRNRDEVIAEICALFGWSKLDDFARKMIDDAFAGEIVDIRQLKADIAAWREKQNGAEEKENADISAQNV